MLAEHRWRLPLAVATIAAYWACLWVAPEPDRAHFVALSMVPVLTGAALYGLAGGAATFAAVFLVDWWLFPVLTFSLSGLVGHALLLPALVGAAWLRRLLMHAHRQAAALTAMAAAQERLRAAETYRAEQRDALVRLTPALLAAQSEREVLETVGRDLRRLVECERSVVVYLVEDASAGGPLAGGCPAEGTPLSEQTRLVPAYADGAVAPAVLARGAHGLTGAAGHAVRTGKPYVVRPAGDPIAVPVPGAPDQPGAMIAVPLLGRNGPVGVAVLTSYRPVPYSAEEAETALLFCDQAGLALENLWLFQAASEARALRRLGELKDELMRTVSHELRTPLSYIYGYSELLTLVDTLPESERQMAVEIHSAAEHMRRMVEDLLKLEELETGTAAIHPVPTDIAERLQRSVELSRLREAGDHQFSLETPPDLPPAMVDPSRFQQVLANLLSNAVRYSPAGSAIGVGASATDERVEVWVRDHGAGLTPEQRDRVFEKFYRGDVELTGKHLGVGLGLSIARSLVEQQGGRLWAESDGPGQGATFRFTLPVAREPAAEVVPAHSLRTNESAASRAALAVPNEPRLR